MQRMVDVLLAVLAAAGLIAAVWVWLAVLPLG
jgi:hypothetical protein